MAAKKPTKMKARKTATRAKATKKASPRSAREAKRGGVVGPIHTLRVPSMDES